MSKRFQFGFDLSQLGTYTDELSGTLIRKAVLESETIKSGINIVPGVKFQQTLNLLDSNLVVQDGFCGGYNASGSTIPFQRTIAVADKKVNESLCPSQLADYYLGMMLKAGANEEEVPYADVILDLKKSQISQYTENLLWQASSASTAFSGFKELINSANTAGIITVVGANAITGSNGLAEVDKLVTLIPDDIANFDDLVVFMSHSAYRQYLINLRTSNYFHFDLGTSYQDMKIMHPGTNVAVQPVGGLYASNKIVLGSKRYFHAGTDLMSDMDQLKMWWSEDFQEIRMVAKWRIGAQISFPQFFITNGLA